MRTTIGFGRRRGACAGDFAGMSVALAAAAMLSVATGGGALASEPPPAPGEPALRGPEVRAREVPGAPGVFGTGDELGRLRDRIPPPVFREAVLSLRDESVPAELRLSEEQQQGMRRLQQEFEQERREYMAEHRDEIRALRAEMAAARGERGEDAGDDAMKDAPMTERRPDRDGPGREAMTPAARLAAERIREIERAAPQPEVLYTRVWESLSAEQRKAVEAKLEDFRAQRAKEREERYVRQRAPRDGRPGEAPMMEGAAPPPPEMREREVRRPMDRADRGAGGADDRLSPEQRERIDRLLRVFNQLPPEAQEQLLTRLEQRARELGAGPDARRAGPPPRDGARRRPERRPPPSMDEVDVPKPDRGG